GSPRRIFQYSSNYLVNRRCQASPNRLALSSRQKTLCAGPPSLLGRDGRRNRTDNHGRHLELRGTIPDVVPPGDPLEIGPDRPHIAVVVLRQQQPDRPVEPGVGVRRDELGSKGRISEYQQG